jgi:hypothetical protein
LDGKADTADFETIIRVLADLPTPSGGFIDLEANKTYRFQGLVNIGTNRIRCGVSNTVFGFDKSSDGIVYTGTDSAILCENQDVTVSNITIFSPNGRNVDVINTTSYSAQIRECILSGGTIGNIAGSNLFAFNNNICTNGELDLSGTFLKVGIAVNFFLSATAIEQVCIDTATFTTLKIVDNDFTVASGKIGILVANTTITTDGGGAIISNTFSGLGTYISGVDDTTSEWTIEANGEHITSTSQRKFVRKIRNKTQLINFLAGATPSIYAYEIDGVIDMGADSIVVPSTGLTFIGYGNNFSNLYTSANGATLFAGGGNLFVNDIKLSCTGTSSKLFNLTDPTGTNACEFVNVNFENVVEIGSLSGYRQGLILNGGFYSVSQGFTLNGAWSGGFRIDVANSSALSATGFVLFKAGVGFTVGNRFVSNANLTINSPAIGYQFTAANFLADAGFQLVDGIFRGTGTFVDGIAASSIRSLWRDTIGVDDTFQGVVFNNTADRTTDIVTTNLYTELSANVAVTEATWFSSQSAAFYRARYDSSVSINVAIELFLSLSGNANAEIEIEIRNYEAALGGGFTSLGSFKLTTNGGTLGTRVEPVSLKAFDKVLQNDIIRVFARNTSGNQDISLEANSKLIISKR